MKWALFSGTWSWGPLEEKPEGAGGISATRTVAIMFAVTICHGITVMADRNQLGTVGWPFALIAVTTLLAVVIKSLFNALAEWLRSSQGRAITAKVAEKVLSKLTTIPFEELTSAAPGTVKTTTEVTPATMPMAEGE